MNTKFYKAKLKLHVCRFRSADLAPYCGSLPEGVAQEFRQLERRGLRRRGLFQQDPQGLRRRVPHARPIGARGRRRTAAAATTTAATTAAATQRSSSGRALILTHESRREKKMLFFVIFLLILFGIFQNNSKMKT